VRAPLAAALFALCAALAAPHGAAAQMPTPPAEAPAEKPSPKEPAEKPPPQAIPVPDVAGQAEALARRLDQLEELAQPSADVDSLKERIEEAGPLLDGLAGESKQAVEKPPSLDHLNALENEWLLATDELATWRRTLTRRAQELEEALAELDELSERWIRTETEARRAGAPAALLGRIAGARSEIAHTLKIVRARRDTVLSLQNQVGQAEVSSLESLATVRSARSELESQLLRPTAPPFWVAGREFISGDLALERIAAAARRELQRARGYVTREADRIVTHGVVALAVTLAMLWLRSLSRRWPEDDPRRAAAAPIVEKPYAAGTLLAILLVPWFYPRAPWLLGGAIGMLALIPLLRLLPGLLDRGLHPVLWALAGFWALDTLRHLIESVGVLDRVVFGAEMLAAAATVAWLIRPARLVHIPLGSTLPGAVAPTIRLGLLLFVVSLVANALGFVPLARILGESTLNAAYAALLLYAGVRVTNAAMSVVLRSRRAQALYLVRNHRDVLIDRLTRAAQLAAWAGWLWVIAGWFAVRAPLLAAASSLLSWKLELGTIAISLGDFVAFGVTIGVATLISRVLRFVLESDVFPRVHAPRGVPQAISTTLHYTLLTIGVVFAFAAAGVDWSRFTILAGALGVGVGFGLQNVVNNFFSGLILLYERPIQVGDTVEVGNLLGDVRRIGIRSSTVRTWQGAEVIVPNAMLISDQVVNWTLSDRHRRIELPVGVAYGTDPERVLALLEKVAGDHPDVASRPAPLALFLGFGESSLDFELRAWSHRFEIAHVTRSQLAVRVSRALREAGIEIPFPQRDLHLRSTPGGPPDGGSA
jgi:potassium efflux system protein